MIDTAVLMTTIYLPHEEFGQEKNHLELVFGQINTVRYCLTSKIKIGLKVVTGRNYDSLYISSSKNTRDH